MNSPNFSTNWNNLPNEIKMNIIKNLEMNSREPENHKTMDSLTFSTNWNNLPIEIKTKIIKNLDNNSRLELRLCSIDDFKLVNSIPYRKIHHLKLEDNDYEDGFQIVLAENYYSSDKYKFEKFEEFQEKVLKVLKNVDYIKSIEITMQNTVENIKLIMPGNRKIKVEELTLNSCRPEECLKQVDRSVLKKLDFQSNQDIEASAQLYELPQFNSVDELHISNVDVQDDQLMKLKPKKITLSLVSRLTSAGICNFIRERTFDPNFEELHLRWLDYNLRNEIIDTIFRGNENQRRWFVVPSFPEFEIEHNMMEIKMRKIKCHCPIPAVLSNFKKLEYVKIRVEDMNRCYSLFIKEYYNDNVAEWTYQSEERTQDILTENLRNVDYIKRLEVSLECQIRFFRFIPFGSLHKITVGHLKTYCHEWNGLLVYDILKQIEPGHLKCLDLYGENIRNEIYDMQQVIQADFIKISYSNVEDYQLMKLSATRMRFGTARHWPTKHEKLTASGVNKFIKKCLLDLNKRKYDFELVLSYQYEYMEFVSTLLEGLDVFSMKNDQEKDEEFYPSEVIVNSDWDGFKLRLEINDKYLKGKRIEV